MDVQNSHRVIVFRHELFKRSEPFIVRQAEAVSGFKPMYVGRRRFGDSPAGAEHFALWEDRPTTLTTKLIQLATRDPSGYVQYPPCRSAALAHAHFGVEGVYALPLARSLDIPLVTTFHGFDATTSMGSLLRSRKPSWVNYALHRRALARRGQLFLCVSEHIRQRVLALGFPEQRTLLHYIGVDTESLAPVWERPGGPTILHVGRLVEKKGCADLLRAFALLTTKHADAELHIVGEGPLLGLLQELASQLGIARRVTFFGSLPGERVLDLMRTATLLCQPSVTAASGDTEGLPIVLLEACALGLPIVATRHAGIPELVSEGRTGVLVDERSVEALSIALDDVLSESTARLAMAMAARKRVEDQFDLTKQSLALGDIYRRLT